jgi:hypothetical protein
VTATRPLYFSRIAEPLSEAAHQLFALIDGRSDLTTEIVRAND